MEKFPNLANQVCPRCSKPMDLLDEDERRYYCYADDILFVGSENRWAGLTRYSGTDGTIQPPTPLSEDQRRQLEAAKQTGKWIAVLGAILILVLLFLVPLIIYPVVVVAIWFFTRLAMSSLVPHSLRQPVKPSVQSATTSNEEAPWRSSSCPNCGEPMTDQGTQYYCVADDILIHKATGLRMSGVPAEDYFINHQTNAGDLGDLFLSLTRDQIVLSDDNGKIVLSTELKNVRNASITNQRNRSQLRLDTLNQTLHLSTGNDNLWKREIEQRIAAQYSTRVYDESSIVASQMAEPTAMSQSTMFCRECGIRIPRNSKFCNQCGAKLSWI